jgi:hypothetical protein
MKQSELIEAVRIVADASNLACTMLGKDSVTTQELTWLSNKLSKQLDNE